MPPLLNDKAVAALVRLLDVDTSGNYSDRLTQTRAAILDWPVAYLNATESPELRDSGVRQVLAAAAGPSAWCAALINKDADPGPVLMLDPGHWFLPDLLIEWESGRVEHIAVLLGVEGAADQEPEEKLWRTVGSATHFASFLSPWCSELVPIGPSARVVSDDLRVLTSLFSASSSRGHEHAARACSLLEPRNPEWLGELVCLEYGRAGREGTRPERELSKFLRTVSLTITRRYRRLLRSFIQGLDQPILAELRRHPPASIALYNWLLADGNGGAQRQRRKALERSAIFAPMFAEEEHNRLQGDSLAKRGPPGILTAAVDKDAIGLDLLTKETGIQRGVLARLPECCPDSLRSFLRKPQPWREEILPFLKDCPSEWIPMTRAEWGCAMQVTRLQKKLLNVALGMSDDEIRRIGWYSGWRLLMSQALHGGWAKLATDLARKARDSGLPLDAFFMSSIYFPIVSVFESTTSCLLGRTIDHSERAEFLGGYTKWRESLDDGQVAWFWALLRALSLRNLLDWGKTLNRLVMQTEFDQRNPHTGWTPLIRDATPIIHGIAVRELTSLAELRAEREAMRHCVHTRLRPCLAGQVRLFSLQDAKNDDVRLSTLEIRLGSGQLSLGEHSARFNEQPPHRAIAAAEQLIQQLNAGALASNSEAILGSRSARSTVSEQGVFDALDMKIDRCAVDLLPAAVRGGARCLSEVLRRDPGLIELARYRPTLLDRSRKASSRSLL